MILELGGITIKRQYLCTAGQVRLADGITVGFPRQNLDER
jgi:hypothetical protein